jgi:hypothetical protein
MKKAIGAGPIALERPFNSLHEERKTSEKNGSYSYSN